MASNRLCLTEAQNEAIIAQMRQDLEEEMTTEKRRLQSERDVIQTRMDEQDAEVARLTQALKKAAEEPAPGESSGHPAYFRGKLCSPPRSVDEMEFKNKIGEKACMLTPHNNPIQASSRLVQTAVLYKLTAEGGMTRIGVWRGSSKAEKVEDIPVNLTLTLTLTLT